MGLAVFVLECKSLRENAALDSSLVGNEFLQILLVEIIFLGQFFHQGKSLVILCIIIESRNEFAYHLIAHYIYNLLTLEMAMKPIESL